MQEELVALGEEGWGTARKVLLCHPPGGYCFSRGGAGQREDQT